MRRESDGMLPFVFGAFFSIEDMPCFPHGFFYMSFRRAFPLSFFFFFFRLAGFPVGGETGLSATDLHGKKLFLRVLVQVARKFCGHWKIAFSRMNFYSAESDSGKCRIGAKDVFAAWLFVNVWLLMAGVSVFGAMV